MSRKTIRALIGGRELAQIGPGNTVRQACHVLDRFNVDAAVVVEGLNIVGVLSERNVIRRCICESRSTGITLVSEVMTRNPRVIDVDCNLEEAQSLLHEGGFRHIPVMEGSRVFGLFSIHDIPHECRLTFEHFAAWQDRQRAVVRAEEVQ